MKPLLVGESNPYQKSDADARRFAFYPEPRHASGGRLCYDILGLKAGVYLRSFDRTDLCGRMWSMAEARDRAREILFEYDLTNATILLFGAKVAQAFARPTLPFQIHRVPGATLVVLPHPSGRNPAWRIPGAIDRARRLLCELGVPCAPPTREGGSTC